MWALLPKLVTAKLVLPKLVILSTFVEPYRRHYYYAITNNYKIGKIPVDWPQELIVR